MDSFLSSIRFLFSWKFVLIKLLQTTSAIFCIICLHRCHNLFNFNFIFDLFFGKIIRFRADQQTTDFFQQIFLKMKHLILQLLIHEIEPILNLGEKFLLKLSVKLIVLDIIDWSVISFLYRILVFYFCDSFLKQKCFLDRTIQFFMIFYILVLVELY